MGGSPRKRTSQGVKVLWEALECDFRTDSGDDGASPIQGFFDQTGQRFPRNPVTIPRNHSHSAMKHVVVIGGGFAGLTAAKKLGSQKDIRVTVVDKQNHHLFQPLLYQVAMAGLSPADIAAPIRSLLAKYKNVRVLKATVTRVEFENRRVVTDVGNLDYDYVLIAAGAIPTYFGHEDWQGYAPGLKTISQATEIRRRMLDAFEKAERTRDAEEQRRLLTFVVIGGGPTGVELAGAIGEMTRYTLARDFRHVDVRLARVILIEGGDRILPSFTPKHTARATRDLERLGVQVWTNSMVSGIDDDGVSLASERLRSATVIWAAGVQGIRLGFDADVTTDRTGRILVDDYLTVEGHPNVFVAGDLARPGGEDAAPLPGTAPVAMQQGKAVAAAILADRDGKSRSPFKFVDRGQMATIGRNSAVVEIGAIRFSGFLAWLAWLVVHIYFLVGFKNRLFVIVGWAWSWFTFRRGARLIVDREWRLTQPKSQG